MKTILVIGILFLLMVVWTALHDIIKDSENITTEYIAVIVSIVTLPLLIYTLVKKIKS